LRSASYPLFHGHVVTITPARRAGEKKRKKGGRPRCGTSSAGPSKRKKEEVAMWRPSRSHIAICCPGAEAGREKGEKRTEANGRADVVNVDSYLNAGSEKGEGGETRESVPGRLHRFLQHARGDLTPAEREGRKREKKKKGRSSRLGQVASSSLAGGGAALVLLAPAVSMRLSTCKGDSRKKRKRRKGKGGNRTPSRDRA